MPRSKYKLFERLSSMQYSNENDCAKDILTLEIHSSEDTDDDHVQTTDKNDIVKPKDDTNLITNPRKYTLALQWCLLITFLLGIALSVATLASESLKSAKPVIGLAIWQWALLITALLAGPVLSHAIKKFILVYTNHYTNEVYYLVMLLANAWAVLYFSVILLAWYWVVNPPDYIKAPQAVSHQEMNNILIKFAKVKHTVTLTLITILLGSFLWLVKDFCIMYGKKRFHTLRFFGRIKNSLMDEYRIKILSGQPPLGGSPSKILFYSNKNFFGKTVEMKIDLERLMKVTEERVSSWMMKNLVDRITEGRKLKYIDNHNKEIDFESEMCGNEVGKIIFSRMASQEVQDYHKITKDQLRESLSKYFNAEEAPHVMQWLLQGADTNNISKHLIKKRIVRAWSERTALVRAMQSNKSIFKQLNFAVNVILIILIFVVWLVMFKVEFRRAMIVVGGAIVGSAFLIGDISKKLVDSLVFIFINHPYDVGDCCLIDNTPVTIFEIKILTTVAYTLDNELKFYPHQILSGLSISNYTRSQSNRGDYVEFYLDILTPEEKITTLKHEIRRFIRKNPQDWKRNMWLLVEFEIKDGKNCLKTTLQFQHTINNHDYREREKRKNRLTLEVKKILVKQQLLQ